MISRSQIGLIFLNDFFKIKFFLNSLEPESLNFYFTSFFKTFTKYLRSEKKIAYDNDSYYLDI